MNDFLRVDDAQTSGTDAPPIDGRSTVGPEVSSLDIAEAARSAAGLPLAEGARLLIELALTGTGWTAGALSGPGPARRPQTRASSAALADRCEQLQWTHGEGPTHDILRAGTGPEIVADLSHDQRWPRWVPSARNLGVRSVLAIGLHVDRPVGALTLYASEPVTGGAGLGLVRAVAAHLSVLVDTVDTRYHLERALDTRTRIGQAIGILMHRYRISADQSFHLLRRISQERNIKIATLATDLVDHGVIPVPPLDDPAGRNEDSRPSRLVR